TRFYPLKDLSGITLGYVGEISSEKLKRYRSEGEKGYSMGDEIGVSGLEKTWEKYLRGQDGYEQRIVDATGRVVTTEDLSSLLHEEEAVSGNHLVTTLDLDLQRYAQERFGQRTGAAAVLSVKTGEILAFVSRPSYDPNILSGNVSPEQWKSLIEDPMKPFLNRLYQAAYPPGSTYKIIVAAAALEEGVIDFKQTVYCPGHLYFGRLFRCWKEGGHGTVNIKKAMVESCDVFFYEMGRRLGVDRIAKYAKKFGLGEKTGIQLEGESAGLIPTQEWKLKNRHQAWMKTEDLSIAIGQGYDLVTPLQNALLIAAVANGGKKIRPFLVSEAKTPAGEVVYRFEPEEGERIGLKPETIQFLQEALIGVVKDNGGTAHGLSWRKVSMAGKTGTAQVVSEEGKSRFKGLKGDHSWFVAYSPTEAPEIAISVLVEHGGHGSSVAAPMA
ncbi:MAG: penicillin-binding protein 2, partial [bacterium]|nr:penicillin-binding protein 2 [bacterium]